LKTVSFFMLFIYWSIIILAPVISKEPEVFKKEKVILPATKPNK